MVENELNKRKELSMQYEKMSLRDFQIGQDLRYMAKVFYV